MPTLPRLSKEEISNFLRVLERLLVVIVLITIICLASAYFHKDLDIIKVIPVIVGVVDSIVN